MTHSSENTVRGAPGRARIECVGVRALDKRRVDVAVDLVLGPEPLSVEMVIVGPDGKELCSAQVIHNHQVALDKIMHLRADAESGDHTLHVGLFRDEELLDHVVRHFDFPAADAAKES